MVQQRKHDLCHAAAPCSGSSPSTRTIHQAAAAWAWFEHSGSTCITPRKAQGRISARLLATSISAGPSRFKRELLCRFIIHQRSSLRSTDPASCTKDDDCRRRHSFHDYDLTERSSLVTYSWRISSTCGSAPNSQYFNIGCDADQKKEDNEEGRNNSCKDEASSLLDKFEVEAVRRKLHEHFSSSHGSISCTPGSACRTNLCHELHEAQNVRHHDHPQTHLKRHRHYFKSHGAAPTAKPSADNVHHHTYINDVVHRLLHSRIKMWSSHSTSASGPVLCSSIAIANSIIDSRRHPAAPKEFRAVSPSRPTTKLQQDALHDRSPNQPYHSDAIYLKAFHESHASQTLPHTSALLGHNMHANSPWRDVDDSVLCRKLPHRHFHEHHHIHHHHHHYHNLQNIDYEPHDGLHQQNRQATNKDGTHAQHQPKLYSLHKEKLMIRPHGERH